MAMTARYLPQIDLQPSSHQRRVERLQERLAAAKLAAVTVKTPERLQEVADEIASVELEWKEINT
ncbi:hypothetical protein ABIB80_000251 [Bradyrhizobium sp. i1.15.2]|uniref:hypothetical protein n=1 Tax=Bradyrhizobium sp. i1.15.2 TaxID=3156362 RepID=UPI0033924600